MSELEAGESDPASAARALVRRGQELFDSGHHAEAFAAWDEVFERYGGSDDPELRACGARGLQRKGYSLGKAGRDEEAVTAFQDLDGRFGGVDEPPQVAEVVALGLLGRAAALKRLGRHDDRIPLYDAVLARYGDTHHPEILVRVAWALFNKTTRLNELAKYAEAIDCADDLLVRCGGVALTADVEGLVARTLLSKAAALDKVGRHEEEIESYDLLVERFGSSQVPAQQTRVAKALYWKIITLNQLGRYAETIACADDLETRVAGNAQVSAEIEEQVARGLLESARALNQLGRRDGEIQTTERATTWFQRAAEAGNSGACLYLGSKCSERGAWDEAETWFRRGAEAGSSVATFNLGVALERLNDFAGSEAAYRQAAEMGFSNAFALVGSACQKRDELDEAETWFRRAVETGDAQAMRKLGYLLEAKGELSAGEQSVRQAAEAGDAQAMMALGWRLEQRGKAVEGRQWNERGIAAGYRYAPLGSYHRVLHTAWWVGRYGPLILVVLAAVFARDVDLVGVVVILILAPAVFTAVAVRLAVLAHRRGGIPTEGADMRWFDSMHPAASYLFGLLIPAGLISAFGAAGASIYILLWGALSLLLRFPFQQPLERSRLPEQAQQLLERFPNVTATVLDKDVEAPVGGLVYRRGRITLNHSTLDQSPDAVTFVVAHELAHAELQGVTHAKLERLAGDAACAIGACALTAATGELTWLGAASGTSVRTLLTTTALALGVAHIIMDPVTAWRSRRFELEADRLAVGLLPPADRERIVKRVVNLPLRLPRTYQLLARSHPTDAERLTLLDNKPPAIKVGAASHDSPDATLASTASDAPHPGTS